MNDLKSTVPVPTTSGNGKSCSFDVQTGSNDFTSRVGWHVSHNLKVVNNVLLALQQSNPEAFKRQFNLKRVMVMFFGKIPRGKAKSPPAVLPDDYLEPDGLIDQISEAQKLLPIFSSLPRRAFFKHPFLMTWTGTKLKNSW